MIVDDDPLVLKVLKKVFSQCKDFKVEATVSSGSDAIDILETACVDVVLADIHMPQMNGIRLLEKLQKMQSSPVFVAMTALDSDRVLLKVLQGGAKGYILKTQPPALVVQAVRSALRGGALISPESLERLLNSFSPYPKLKNPHSPANSANKLGESLSDIEQKIISLLCQGKSNSDIAAAMSYSESTIKKRVSILIHKFGCSSRLDLVIHLLEIS